MGLFMPACQINQQPESAKHKNEGA